jgi:hypothetical protein
MLTLLRESRRTSIRPSGIVTVVLIPNACVAWLSPVLVTLSVQFIVWGEMTNAFPFARTAWLAGLSLVSIMIEVAGLLNLSKDRVKIFTRRVSLTDCVATLPQQSHGLPAVKRMRPYAILI